MYREDCELAMTRVFAVIGYRLTAISFWSAARLAQGSVIFPTNDADSTKSRPPNVR